MMRQYKGIMDSERWEAVEVNEIILMQKVREGLPLNWFVQACSSDGKWHRDPQAIPFSYDTLEVIE